jgi:hypothetical protein
MKTWRENGYRDSDGKRVVNATLFRYFDVLCDARISAGQDIVVQDTSQLETSQGHDSAKKLSGLGTKLPDLLDRDWEALIQYCLNARPIMADTSNPAVAGSVGRILIER